MILEKLKVNELIRSYLYERVKTCKYVITNSEYVKIDFKKLDEFISRIDCNNLKNWLLFNPYNLLELDIEKIINFLLMFEALIILFGDNLNGLLTQ